MLASQKPIWSGEVANCGIILVTNVLVSLGFRVIHSNGTEVNPEGRVATVQQNIAAKLVTTSEGHGESSPEPHVAEPEKPIEVGSSLRVSLDHAMRVGPQQTTVVKVKIGELVYKYKLQEVLKYLQEDLLQGIVIS